VDRLFSLAHPEGRLPDPALFDGLDGPDRENWITYLYTRPKIDGAKLNSRSHIVGLYDPFASRAEFPAGRRWCVNVYTGCAFGCRYCYALGYIQDAFKPRIKKNFERLLVKDVAEIGRLKLHPAPIHISNSTDPLQGLEMSHHHTLFLLEHLRTHEEFFTTITILTKNPSVLCRPEYLTIISRLTTFQVEVTCPFFRDEARKFYEPFAPSVRHRLEAIRTLRAAGISVSLRIDPLFPRDPLPADVFGNKHLADYGIPVSQTDEDFEELIKFASGVGCRRIIVSPLKLIVSGRCVRSDLTDIFLPVYRDAAGTKPIRKGTSYRLPWPVYHKLIEKPRHIARTYGIDIVYCKDNLIGTT
jgi:DNA repair photolyase